MALSHSAATYMYIQVETTCFCEENTNMTILTQDISVPGKFTHS